MMVRPKVKPGFFSSLGYFIETSGATLLGMETTSRTITIHIEVPEDPADAEKKTPESLLEAVERFR